MFRSNGISSSSSMALFGLTSMHGPFWESCVHRILCLVKDQPFNLLNQLENLFQVWPEHVVPFRCHRFQQDHPQID